MKEITVSLLLERGPQPNQRFILSGEQSTIGRSSANDIVIVDPEVSRRHARILHQPEQLSLEDLGSTNGTFLNGHRVTHLTAIQSGDVIDLGDSITLRVLTAVGPAVVSPTAMATPAPTARSPAASSSTVADVDYEGYEWGEPADEGEDFVFYSTPDVEQFAHPEPTPREVAPPWPESAYKPVPHSIPTARPRRLWIGCLLALLAISFLCIGSIVFLDAYDQGRLLYCGPLRPIFETILGPVGFAPPCL